MNLDPIFYLTMIVMVAAGFLPWKRGQTSIALESTKFWSLVRSQERPVVLMTTRGFLIKELCYLFPYQGILFHTAARGTRTPDGVKLIGVGETPELR